MESSHTAIAPQTSENRRWPAVYAFVTCWLWPGTTARRMGHVGIGAALGIHLLSIVLSLIVIAGLAGWIDHPEQPILEATVEQILQVYLEAQRELVRGPMFFLAVISIVVLVLELVFILLGLLLAPWGAGDERFRDTFRHAARLHWLSSPHWVVAILLCGLGIGPMAHASRAWYSAYSSVTVSLPPWPARPTVTLGPNPTQAEQDTYDTAQQAYQKEVTAVNLQRREVWDKWYAGQPWYIKYDEIILFWIILPVAAWRLWALFRIIAERPAPPPIERPPTCESCGYDLTGAAYWGKCPECGDGVERSLGETARCGTPWEHRRRLGRFVAWRQTARLALRDPAALGRLIRTTGEARDHRHFLGVHLPLIALVTAAGVFLINLIAFSRHRPGDALDIMALTTPGAGLGAAMATPLFCGLAAMATGYWMGRIVRRNLMGAAARVAAYLSPFLVLWIGFAALLGVGVVAYLPYLDLAARALNLNDESLAAIVFVAPNLVWLLLYMSRLFRGVSAMRFANR